MPLPPGQLLGGKYRIQRELGTGGMGVVYAGVHERIKKRVAVKVLHPHLNQQAELVARFEREAQAAARIGSEHIVDVYDVGELDSGEHYMVMELLVGESLSRFIKRGLDAMSLFAVTLEVLEGLAAAHEVDNVHRDLKPANIFVARGTRRGPDNVVKLLDFGVSKFRDLVGEGSTATGAVIGTPHYMAPEQALAREVDGRADLYSVGVLLYRALSRKYPYSAKTMPELIAQLMSEDAPSLASVMDVHPAIAQLVDRALRREPDERFASASEMKRGLLDCLVSLGAPEPAPIPAPVLDSVAEQELQTPGTGVSTIGDATTAAIDVDQSGETAVMTPASFSSLGETIPVTAAHDSFAPTPVSNADALRASATPPPLLQTGTRQPGRDTILRQRRAIPLLIGVAVMAVVGATAGALFVVNRPAANTPTPATAAPNEATPADPAPAEPIPPEPALGETSSMHTASAGDVGGAGPEASSSPSAEPASSTSASPTAPKAARVPATRPTPSAKPPSGQRTDAIREDL
jgi:serine/threonine-protein kinase